MVALALHRKRPARAASGPHLSQSSSAGSELPDFPSSKAWCHNIAKKLSDQNWELGASYLKLCFLCSLIDSIFCLAIAEKVFNIFVVI